MISTGRSTSPTPNPDLKELPARSGEGNLRWLARAASKGRLLLVGGATLSHFRLRLAQAHVRRDLLPSFWSAAAILRPGGTSLDTVTFSWGGSASAIPATNAIATRPLDHYDDPESYPNIAILHFEADSAELTSGVERLRADRAVVDLPRLLVEWLGFIWGAGTRGNPLLDRMDIPSACLVEAAYGLAGLELTPGLSSDASCPEAIWQSVKWWRTYYEESVKDAKGKPQKVRPPRGVYALRQPAAAVTVENRPP